MNKKTLIFLFILSLSVFSIFTAKAGNNPPIALNDTIYIHEDTTDVFIDILNNDSDPDGDALTLTIQSTAHGEAIMSSGKIKYTPYTDFNGMDTIVYQICDNGIPSLCKKAFVIIYLSAVNDAPIANDDIGITAANTSFFLNVTKNDFDMDGDTLSISIVGPPLRGTAIVVGKDSIQYTPNAGFNSGIDQIIYEVCDHTNPSFCSTAIIKISIPIKNLAPVVTDENVYVKEDGKIQVDVVANDYDPNGNPLTMLILNPGGKAVSNSPGVITYTPTPNYFGSDVLTYVVCDNAAPTLCSTGSLIITVLPVNDNPIAYPDHTSMTEDNGTIDIDVTGNDTDPDGDNLFTSVSQAPLHGTAVALSNGKIRYQPQLNFTGVDQFIYSSCDHTAGLCDTSIVYIQINNINDAPITRAESYTMNEDDSIAFNVLFNDIEPDADPMNVSIIVNPAHGKASVNANGTVSYKPNVDFNGSDVIYLNICDTILCTIDTLNIKINAVNDRPKAQRDTLTLNEDAPIISISVKSNDSDIDGDPLTVSILVQPQLGTAVVNTFGGIDYTANSNKHGKDSLLYQICDSALCTTAYMVIQIKSIPDPPQANPDQYSNNEDFPGIIVVQGNDIDLEGSPLTTTIYKGPNHGTAYISGGIYIAYIPDPNFNGQDQIIYQVCDTAAAQLCDTSILTITIVPVNDRPSVNSDHFNMNEDGGTANIQVLLNDNDPENAPLTLNIKKQPLHGTQTNSNGIISYTPAANYFGNDVIVYEICDDLGLCDTATLFIHIHSVNDQPIASADTYTCNEDIAGNITVLTNDTDVDGDPLSVSIIQNPKHGFISILGGTLVKYTPNPDYFGTDDFIYQACDTANPTLCDTALVNITINSVNDAPHANSETLQLNEDSGPSSMNALSNDFDPENDPMLISILTNPSNGTASISAGIITYTPNLNFNGNDFLIYQVCDIFGLCDTAKFKLLVAPVNDAPIAKGDYYTNNEDNICNINIGGNDNDIDGDPLTLNIITSPKNGTASVSGSNIIVYTPNQNFNGNETIIYEICDNGNPALCDTAVLKIQILPINDAPVALTDYTNTNEDTPLTFNALTNDYDVEGNKLTPKVYSAPAHGSVSINGSGKFVYIPSKDYFGVDSFIYEICDNGSPSQCDTSVVFINISSVNDKPIANADHQTIAEDSPLTTIHVSGNDTDVDGNLFTTSIMSPPASGTASVNTNGDIEYTPTANYNGNVVIIYNLCDNGTPTLCDTAKLFIQVTAVNDVPVATTDHLQIIEDAAATNTSVLLNDLDVDGNALTVSILNMPKNGTTSVNTNKSIKYKPAANFSGSDTLIYQICDNGTPQLCDTAKLIIQVTPVNDAPVAKSDHLNILEDATATNVVVITNDVDPDGNPLIVSILNLPKHGTAILNANKSISYKPSANFNGADTLIYQICDNATPQLCDTAKLIIKITAVNDAPLANTDHLQIAEDAATTVVTIISNDVDVDGNPLTVSMIKTPAHGTAILNTNKTLSYKPKANYNGMDTIIYQICDNGTPQLCDTAKVIIKITSVNDAPIAKTDHLLLTEDAASTNLVIITNDLDVDGNPLTVSFIQAPKHGIANINSNKSINYKPSANFNGSDTIIYQVCDNGTPQLCDTAKIIINITAVNDAPIANADHLQVAEDDPLTKFIIVSNDVEVDGNPLTVKLIKLPAHGTAILNADLSINYKPNANFNGKDTLIYEICDNGTPQLCDTAKIFIKVTPVNDAPVANSDFMQMAEDAAATNIIVIGNDSDIDGNPLTVSIIQMPSHGTAFINTNKSIKYQPSPNYNGADTLIYQICDNGNPQLCDTAKLIINITPVNDKPLANSDHLQILEDAAISNIVVLANDTDIDGDPLTISIIKLPSHGIANTIGNNSINYKPNINYNGTDTLIYQICDNGTPQLCDTAKLIVSISAVNDAPIANTDHKTIAEDSGPNAIVVLSNDQEPDLDPMSVNITQAPKHGIASVNSSGSIIYTPNANFIGNDSLIYNACDNGTPVLCDTAILYLTITPVNDAPIANTDHLNILEDAAAQSVNVIANDVDIEGNPLTVSILKKSTKCIASVVANKISYKPILNFNGKDTLIYQICDNGSPSLCDTAKLIVSIGAVNDKPKAVNDTIQAPNEILSTKNIAKNDLNVDADQLLYSALIAPQHGIASITTTGLLTYQPDINFEGSDSLYYKVCDDGSPSLCDSAKVLIYVKLNHVPLAINDSVYTDFNIPIIIYASQNDTDPDNDLLTYSIFGNPQNGSVMMQSNGNFIYRPNADYSGKDQFTYEVCDNNTYSKCSKAIAYITIGEAPSLPDIDNGFSPNGDGINEGWHIKDIEKYPANEVFIFNRWGSEVWSTKNYSNTDNQWFGKNISGDELPDGTYYYIIKYDELNQQKGWVIIKR